MVSTCMQLFEGLIGKERDPCIWDNTQNGGGEASVKRPHTFFLGDPHKDVQDVTVPVAGNTQTFAHHMVLLH